MTRACGGDAGVDWEQRADVVVIGTGVAGLAAALAAHRRGSRAVVLSKATETATFYAQGGIAVVLPHTDDSIEAHVADTLSAGAGLCDEQAVRSIVTECSQAVGDLIADGLHDRIHEPYRWGLIQGGRAVREAALEAGAWGCVISGAGPTLLALASASVAEAVSTAMVKAWEAEGVASTGSVLDLQMAGSRWEPLPSRTQ
jgi:hypothetical protein